MRKQHIGLLIIFVFLTIDLFSQISADKYRRTNYKVLQLIADYNLYCNPLGINNDEKFINLFSENALIYNDFLPENATQYVTPKEYYGLLSKRDNTKMNIEIWRVAFDELMKETKNGYIYTVSFKKAVVVTNWNNITYPRIEFPLVAHIFVEKDLSSCRIDSIICEQPLTSFSLLKLNRAKIDRGGIKVNIAGEIQQIKHSQRDTILYLPGIVDAQKSVKFNSYEYEVKIVPDTFPDKDSKVNFMILKPLKNSIGLETQLNAQQYTFTPGFPHSTSTLKSIFQKNSGFSFGLSYQRKIKYSSSNCLLLLSGIGLDFEQVSFNGDYSTEYNDTDTDGDNYTRRVNLNGLTEKIDLKFLKLPIGIQDNFYFTNQFGVFASFGINVYYAFQQKSTFTSDASYKGYYPQYDNLLLDRYYDFGYYKLNNTIEKVDIPAVSFASFARAGFTYRYSKRWNMQVGIQYMKGITNLANYKSDYYISKTKTDITSVYRAYEAVRKNNLSISLQLNYNY